MNILLNYQYDLYPFTTASYFEMAIKSHKKHKLVKRDEAFNEKIDLVINIEPVPCMVRMSGVPSVYYEIDNHVIRGSDKHWYIDTDLIFLAQPYFKDFYKDWKTDNLPLACCPDVHKRYEDEPQEYDIGFIGNDTYPYRRMLLDILSANYKVLRTTAEPGEPYSRLLNRCKIIFNCAMDNDVNMRFFEGMACGRLLLSDYLPEQDNYAIDGVHYVAYRSVDELLEKVNYYLKNNKEREKIAKQGMEHVHKNHNYNIRLEELLCLAKNHLSLS